MRVQTAFSSGRVTLDVEAKILLDFVGIGYQKATSLLLSPSDASSSGYFSGRVTLAAVVKKLLDFEDSGYSST
jgi:hypothetical protein